MTQPIDALIFDMDGTMWDAVDSYCKVWDATAAELGIGRQPVRYEELVALMGKPLGEIYEPLMGAYCSDKELFLERLSVNEERLMSSLGGRLYPGVAEVTERLSKRYKLFMLSNCNGSGLDNFLDFTGLRPYFTDAVTFGQTGVDKDVNLRRIRERYNLRRPVYVGDIQRDADSTHAAGLEFVWAAYGFGTVSDAEFRINNFYELETNVLNNGNKI